ncbi:exonuclease 1 isoform X2 [Malus sylvestris]|uniref:exonuclease 1 isoform X2 n=1 Tax=Malus sylvestris TaxID=3752 RepID=UPI0021ABFA44|nr:exonuclease 1 isoform X2 [Malus sylvestris]
MGIKDLLRFLKPFIAPIHVKKYAGKRVGIDAYSWLHKGAYSCSLELGLNSNSERKLKYIDYFMHRINMLRHHKITPVVVFDGGNVPCKATTEHERHRRRKTNRDLAMAKYREGDIRAATELFQVLRSENVEFVVAPYEADAQLAYLCSLEAEKGGIAAVITEDSDLVAYGCQAIVFKMDHYGNGEEIVLENVFNPGSRKPSFQNFDQELFTGMCVLAGCDFLPSVHGIGIAKAYALVAKYRNLDRALSALKSQKGSQMAEDYPKCFREAVAVFQHAQIYDADKKNVKHMKPIPQKLVQSLGGELDFLGPEISSSVATAIAEGKLDPINMEAFDHFPASRHHPDPIKNQNSDQTQRTATAIVSAEVSCFVSFPSLKGQKDNARHTEMRNPVLDENACLNEVAALAKLIVQSKNNGTMEGAMAPKTIPLKVPLSNPFKKRKDEIRSDQTGCENTKQTSNAAPEVEALDIKVKVLDNGPSRKRKVDVVHLDHIMSVSERVSGVTEMESSDIVCVTPESQESVNSKLPKGKRVVRNEKLKRSSCKSSGSKNSSILNFFSRV